MVRSIALAVGWCTGSRMPVDCCAGSRLLRAAGRGHLMWLLPGDPYGVSEELKHRKERHGLIQERGGNAVPSR